MTTDSRLELSSTETPQLPEVVIDGHKVAGGSREALSEIYELINMANIAKIRRYFDDRTSHGGIQNFENILITDTSPSQEFQLVPPAQSISITNDGAVGAPPLWIYINRRFDSRRTLNPGETLNINFETHKLERFFLQCPPGLATNLWRATARG